MPVEKDDLKMRVEMFLRWNFLASEDDAYGNFTFNA